LPTTIPLGKVNEKVEQVPHIRCIRMDNDKRFILECKLSGTFISYVDIDERK
jgi:hypothetical protein